MGRLIPSTPAFLLLSEHVSFKIQVNSENSNSARVLGPFILEWNLTGGKGNHRSERFGCVSFWLIIVVYNEQVSNSEPSKEKCTRLRCKYIKGKVYLEGS